MSSLLRDECTATRYSHWGSLVTGLGATTMAVGLSSVLGLYTHLPAAVLGIVRGLLLYELVRILVVCSGWPPSRTRAWQLLAYAVRLRSRFESTDPSTPRLRP